MPALSLEDDAALPPAVARILLRAASEVHVLGALAPRNAATERARLTAALEKGLPARPRWTYAPAPHERLLRELAAAEALVRPGASPLAAASLERLRELSVEARLCAAAGSVEVGRMAGERFPEPPPGVAGEASATADTWLRAPAPRAEGPTLASDDPSPRSLLSRLRAEVSRRLLPFSVVVHPGLASLAATGARLILVAPGRPLTEEDVERTVVHEIEGHAMPRARAERGRHLLLRVGTARGVDHQEGLALLCEERAGLLGPRRRRQLAARHRAVEAMRDGATFDDVARSLTRDHGLEAADAVLAAERAFRGGDGACPGLGRERVYLESLLRVRARLLARPEDERVLAAGQVGLEAIEALAAFV